VVITVILCLVVALSAAACSATAGAESSPNAVKIGLLAPFSGPSSNYGPDELAGVRLALHEAGMKVGDRPIKLVTANENVGDASETLNNLKKLVLQDGASLLVGPTFGSSQQAVAPFLKESGAMSFVPFGTSKELGGSGHVIGWPTLDTHFSSPLGDFLSKNLGYHKIATISADYVYGHNLMKGVVKRFEANGGSVVQQQWVPLGTSDLLPYATHLDKNVDALVMWLVPQDVATFMKAYRRLNIDVPVIFVNGIFDPTFQSIGARVEGSYGLVAWSAVLHNQQNKSFVENFRKANHGKYPNNISVAAYVDTKLALATLEAAGGSTSFDDLKRAVTTVHLDTPYGPGFIDDDFFGVTNRYVVKATKASNGRYVWKPVKKYTTVRNG
jgi:branched-chain amino acid transport system substrate-binding protein